MSQTTKAVLISVLVVYIIAAAGYLFTVFALKSNRPADNAPPLVPVQPNTGTPKNAIMQPVK